MQHLEPGDWIFSFPPLRLAHRLRSGGFRPPFSSRAGFAGGACCCQGSTWHAEMFMGAPAAGGVTMGGSPNPKNPIVRGAASLEAASGSACPAVAAAPRGQCCLAPGCLAAAPKQSKRSESAFQSCLWSPCA